MRAAQGATEEKKTLKFQMMMSPQEADQLDDWMFQNRVRSRAEAIRQLWQRGLLVESAQALAAMPGEPVAWGAWSGFEHRVIATTTDKMKADAYDGQGDIDIVPLYLAPSPPADKAEIERLRDENKALRLLQRCECGPDEACAVLSKAETDVERLRAYFEAAEDVFEYGEAQAPTHLIRKLHAVRAALNGGDA